MKKNKSLRKRLVQMLVKNIDTFTNQKGKWSLIQVEKKVLLFNYQFHMLTLLFFL